MLREILEGAGLALTVVDMVEAVAVRDFADRVERIKAERDAIERERQVRELVERVREVEPACREVGLPAHLDRCHDL
jgi:hypothetical protein